MTELDGVGSDRDGIFVIAATNRIDLIDKAIMRPGRLEKAVYVPLPNLEQRADILTRQVRPCNKEDNVNYDFFLSRLSPQLDNFSGADLASIVREAGLAAVQRGGTKLT